LWCGCTPTAQRVRSNVLIASPSLVLYDERGDFMERHTADIFCFFVLFLVSLVFVFDLFGATGAALKKKEYKSMIGSFVEKLSDSGLWWFPLLVALFYIYGFYISVNF
jgi:hypothetical protein